MKEVKTTKKPLAYYYGIVLIMLIVFNLVVTPILMEHQVKETDYGTFIFNSHICFIICFFESFC